MFKQLFILFLTIHIVADFYLQSDKLAIKKHQNYKYVLWHSVFYLIASVIFVLPFFTVALLICAVALSVLHFIFDSIKFICVKNKIQNAVYYAADQLVHLCCIAVISAVAVYLGHSLTLLGTINSFLLLFTSKPLIIFKWISLLLIMIKPANITIKELIAKFKPTDNTINVKDTTVFNLTENIDRPSNNAGAFIGSLERIIIVLLLSVGQYAAIGLVLTAKSVARYNKISESKQFAEYYLLGTLLSTLFAIVFYFIFSFP